MGERLKVQGGEAPSPDAMLKSKAAQKVWLCAGGRKGEEGGRGREGQGGAGREVWRMGRGGGGKRWKSHTKEVEECVKRVAAECWANTRVSNRCGTAWPKS